MTAFIILIVSYSHSYSFDFATDPVNYVLSHDGKSYKQIKDLNLIEANLSGQTLRDLQFYDCNLQGANFSNTTLIGVVFTRTDLTRANFTGATIVRCKFSGSASGVKGKNDKINFTKANFINSQSKVKGIKQRNSWTFIKGAEGINFTGAVFNGDDKSYKYGIELDGEFNNAIFDGATFIGLHKPARNRWDQPSNNIHLAIEGDNIKFDNVKLKGVRITKFPFSENRFRKLEMIKCDLSSCDFRNAVIDDINLSGSFIRYNKFDGATIKKSSFENTTQISNTFKNTSIIGASFRNSWINSCDFTSSNMKDSVFDNSNIRHSKFDKANLTDASFKGVQNLKENTFIGTHVSGIKQ